MVHRSADMEDMEDMETGAKRILENVDLIYTEFNTILDYQKKMQ